MDAFARDFGKPHFTKAWAAYQKAKEAGFAGEAPRVNTWELYDKSFKTMRARKDKKTQKLLDTLQELQENVNSDMSNIEAVNKFAREGKDIRQQLKSTYP